MHGLLWAGLHSPAVSDVSQRAPAGLYQTFLPSQPLLSLLSKPLARRLHFPTGPASQEATESQALSM